MGRNLASECDRRDFLPSPGTDQGRVMAEALRTGQSESGPAAATLPHGKVWAILEVSPTSLCRRQRIY